MTARRSFSNAWASGRSAEQQQAFTTLQRLLLLRRQHLALQSGEEQVLHADRDVLISGALTTGNEGEHIFVAINKGHGFSRISISTDDTSVAGLTQATSLSEHVGTLSLEPKSLAPALSNVPGLHSVTLPPFASWVGSVQ